MKQRLHFLLLLSCAWSQANAQVRSDKAVVLNGSNANDRAVQGLKDATVPTDALNAGVLQAGGYLYGEVNGDAWNAALQPAPGQVTTGMRLLLRTNSTNSGPVTLSVNGSPTYPVVKADNAALQAGDIAVGSTVSVVFDGNAFQLMNARRLERKPCPSGTAQVNELYCIATLQHDTLEFPAAADVCGALGMKLCSWGQFYVACTKATELGITDMVGDWEWTDDGANSDISVRVVGQASCTHASVTVGWGVIARNFHCCFKR